MRTAALTFACALLLMLSENVAAQTPDALLGTWERFGQVNRAGKPMQVPLRAVLIISPDGYYSHNAVKRSGPKTTRPLSQFTLKEMMDRFEGMEARYGKFTVSADTLVRTVIASLDPANLGTTSQQQFEIVGDTLILRSPSTSDKSEVKFRRMR